MKDRLCLALTGLFGGIALGFAITIPAALLAVSSAGLGHGDYALARLLFPHPMLLTRLTQNQFPPSLVVLAVAQFPFYGALIGVSLPWKHRCQVIAGIVLAAHLLAAAACFAGLIPNFS
jgi:hypothetical protein